jgi:DNA-binding CsgD family transcriptional regulator
MCGTVGTCSPTRRAHRSADRRSLLGRGIVSQAHNASVSDVPRLTAKEREVLRELCRPLLTERRFAAPASVREIASNMWVGEAAVKWHLVKLYDKFDIHAVDSSERSGDRRLRLARAAIERGWGDEDAGDREPRRPIGPTPGMGTARPLPDS